MVKKLIQTTEEASDSKSTCGSRSKAKYIHNEMRLTLILLITEFGLSCYQAAKILEVPYTNAKVIYRVFRKDNRLVQNSKSPHGNFNFLPSQADLLCSSFESSRVFGKRKLIEAMTDTALFTTKQREKIYQNNFDELVCTDAISWLNSQGWAFMG